MSPIIGTIASSYRSGVNPGSGTAFESIATQTVTSASVASVTFNSIPNTYTHLQLRYICKSGRSAAMSGFGIIKMNGNFGTQALIMYGNTGEVSGMSFTPNSGSGYTIAATGTSANAASFGVGILDFLDYKDTNKTKIMRTQGAIVGGNTDTTAAINFFGNVWWNSTTTISSIEIIGNDLSTIQQNSTFALYGIKVA